ncbi:MAG: hypothetical protein AB1810_06930 [Pseudomonadota bacterium]
MHTRLLFALALLLTGLNSAQAFDAYPYLSRGAEVSLSWQRTDVDWRIDQDSASGTHYQLKLMGYEAPMGWVQGGLQIGYQELNLSGNPASAGIRQTGEFIGIQLRSPAPRGDWGPYAAGSYRYNSVDGATTSQRVETTWNEYDLEAGVITRLPLLNFTAGVYYAGLSGDQTASGIITANEDIDTDSDTGLSLSLGLALGTSGRFLISSRLGERRSLGIGFARDY